MTQVNLLGWIPVTGVQQSVEIVLGDLELTRRGVLIFVGQQNAAIAEMHARTRTGEKLDALFRGTRTRRRDRQEGASGSSADRTGTVVLLGSTAPQKFVEVVTRRGGLIVDVPDRGPRRDRAVTIAKLRVRPAAENAA